MSSFIREQNEILVNAAKKACSNIISINIAVATSTSGDIISGEPFVLVTKMENNSIKLYGISVRNVEVYPAPNWASI